jgi:hypothetical protein
MSSRSLPLASGVMLIPLALALATAAQAASANFQGCCSWNAAMTQFTCRFDPLRPVSLPSSCPDSFIWKVSFDYGDGTMSGLIPPTTGPTKTFTSSVINPIVKLSVICWSGETATRYRVINHPFGVPGGININGTCN